MMKRISASILLLGVIYSSSFGQTPQADVLLVLKGATIIDGTGASERLNASVIIEGNRILNVVNAGEMSLPENARVVDLEGKWIIPGLIDTHMHFQESGGLYTRPDVYDLRDFYPYEQEISDIKNRISFTLSRYLCAGVTSIMSLGGPQWDFEVRDLSKNTPLAPNVAVAGPWVTAYFPTHIPYWTQEDPAYATISSEKDIEALVSELADLDVDMLKIAPVHPSIVRDFINGAHEYGVRVAIHETVLEKAKSAIRNGVDFLAHPITNLPVDDEFIQLVKERDIVTATTLSVWQSPYQVLTENIELLPIEQSCGDPRIIESWNELKEIPEDERPAVPGWVIADNSEEFQSIVIGNIKRMHDVGLKLAVGSDGGFLGLLHGASYHRELILMEQAGIEPLDIITIATRNGAIVMGREKELGTIESGKLADLVVLEADPLTEIGNVQKVHLVVKDGVIIERTDLIQSH